MLIWKLPKNISNPKPHPSNLSFFLLQLPKSSKPRRPPLFTLLSYPSCLLFTKNSNNNNNKKKCYQSRLPPALMAASTQIPSLPSQRYLSLRPQSVPSQSPQENGPTPPTYSVAPPPPAPPPGTNNRRNHPRGDRLPPRKSDLRPRSRRQGTTTTKRRTRPTTREFDRIIRLRCPSPPLDSFWTPTAGSCWPRPSGSPQL